MARTAPEIAERLLAALDAGRQLDPISNDDPGFDLGAGYTVAGELARLRQARGERIVGRKIGFTNRDMWARYGVEAPLWHWMYDTTVAPLPRDGRVQLPNLPECLIEPELAVCFASAPSPGMTTAEIAGCLDWVAQGYEVVTSLYPGWRFTAADAAAAFTMHGCFWYGPPVPVDRVLADGDLPAFRAHFDGPTGHDGASADLVGGPLQAIQYLMGQIDRMPGAHPIRPGEVITTGSLVSPPPPARAGEAWRTRLMGIALPDAQISFA